MLNQSVELLKRSFIEQKVDAFACRHLSRGMLLLNARGAAAGLCSSLALAQLLEFG